jgi:IclR family transcriptional regulator, KDG regulon repressor
MRKLAFHTPRLTSFKDRCHMIHSVSNASTVLKLFSEDIPEWGVSEAAKRLGLAKSTASEMMSTLASQGLLARTSTGRYRLGWYLLELSRTLLNTSDFYTEANPVMRGLVSRWGVSTSLGVLSGSQFTFVERLYASSRMQNIISQFNRPIPVYGSSIGKALLANQKQLEVTKLIEKQGLLPLTPNTITTENRLIYELEQIRRQGYALDKEEVLSGICSVSAPIFDLDGRVIASISLVVPATSFYPHQEHFADIISNAGQRISENIGYREKIQRT